MKESIINMTRKHFVRIFTTMFAEALLMSCNTIQTARTPSNTENLTTPSEVIATTKLPTSTATLSIDFTSTPSPFPTTSEQATLQAFGPLCINSNYILRSGISPNGKWITAECIGTLEKPNSHLQVVSLDKSKNWELYYGDYANGTLYDHKDILVPYHWSKDGRFLYAVAGSRLSGCCWIGHRYMLLVRLNLETGEQLELLNAIDLNSAFPFDFIISDSDRYLLFTSPTNQPYDFAVWDLQTWKTRAVYVKLPKNIDLNYAVFSPAENKIVLPLFEYHQESSDFSLDSIGLIDLKTDQQKLLISGLKQGEELYPIRWVDENQVLLSSVNPDYSYSTALQASAKYWLLNIHTNELVKTEKP